MSVRSGEGRVFASVLRAGPGAFVFTGLAGILALVPGLAVPLLIRALLDQYLIIGATEWGLPIIAGLLVAALLAALLTWLQFRVLSRFALRLSASRSAAFVWHALRVPLPKIGELGSGDVAARGATTQRFAFQGGVLLPLALINVFTLVVFCAALLILDLRLGGAALAVVLVSMIFSLVMLRRRLAYQKEADRSRVAQTALTNEIVSGIETAKAAAAEQWVFDRWCRSRDRVARANSELGRSGQLLGMIGPLVPTLGLGVVMAVGVWLVLGGRLSLGTLVASQALLLQALIPAGKFVTFGMLQNAVTSAESQASLVERMPLDPEVSTVCGGKPVADPGPLAVSLRSVTFGYDPERPPLLKEVDLEVVAGSRVALVGGSGSGKSTLIRLIVGELQPWSGNVCLGGIPRLEWPRAERTGAVGYVPQVPVVIPGTLRQNLTLFDPGIAAEDVDAAVRDARFEEAVESRPLGLGEEISGAGHGLSGGEMQRLAIARALSSRPRVLILDEATSALDPLIEAEVESNLRGRECTSIVVAHRLSTIRDADQILVLDKGRIVQRGTYEELKNEGLFAELVHG